MEMHTPPLIPAKAGTQFFGLSVFPERALTAIPSARALLKHWVPAFAGMSGNEFQGLTA
jgi:hypothetical protein